MVNIIFKLKRIELKEKFLINNLIDKEMLVIMVTKKCLTMTV